MLDITMLDPTARTLNTALDGLSLRQQVTGNNIANIDTPGFKSAEVDFETQLRRAMAQSSALALATTNPAHLTATGGLAGSIDGPVVSTSNNLSMRNDGNNVDIDREMARLAETSIMYDALAQQMSAKLALLKTIISEGRR